MTPSLKLCAFFTFPCSPTPPIDGNRVQNIGLDMDRLDPLINRKKGGQSLESVNLNHAINKILLKIRYITKTYVRKRVSLQYHLRSYYY